MSAISSFRLLMLLGMVNIKVKSRVVVEAMSTPLNSIAILPHGRTRTQWGRGRKAPQAFDLNFAGIW